MSEQLTPQQWFERIQGTQDAILRVLGELLAKNADCEAIIRLANIDPALDLGSETDLQKQRRLGMEIGRKSVLVYASIALARVEALRVDTSNPQ